MKNDDQTLTEWVADAITFHSCRKDWCFTRAHVVRLIDTFRRRRDILIEQFNGLVPLHVYDVFPVNTLRDFYKLFDQGGTITPQEFARCENINDIERVLCSVRNIGGLK